MIKSIGTPGCIIELMKVPHSNYEVFCCDIHKTKITDDPMLLKDASKITEHLKEKVLDENKVDGIQKHILRVIVYPEVSVEADLWGKISYKIKLQ